MSQGPQSDMDRITSSLMSRETRNKYTCRLCGKHIITEDRDEGTTPFMIDCKATKGCPGTMQSAFYRVTGDEPPTFIWRKPTRGEYKRAHPAMRQHFDQGGLDLHPLPKT